MTEERAPPLRQRMIEDMRIRGMGGKHQKSHIRAIKDFAAFLGRSLNPRAFPIAGSKACAVCTLGGFRKRPFIISQRIRGVQIPWIGYISWCCMAKTFDHWPSGYALHIKDNRIRLCIKLALHLLNRS